jgi:hypothetical protein
MNYLVNHLFVYFIFCLFKDFISGRGVNKCLGRFSCIFLEMVEPSQLVDADRFIILGLIFSVNGSHYIFSTFSWDSITQLQNIQKHSIEKTQQHIQKCDIYMRICIQQVMYMDRFMTFNRVRIMVFNATFNNISAISWRLVLLVEETGETTGLS